MSSDERLGSGQAGQSTSAPKAGARPSLGVIITNRDRTGPLDGCLGSLAAQQAPPAWVLLADLGSAPPHRAAMAALADRYQVSCVRIGHSGPWNKSLAFNTAFRLALRSLPAVSHVIQLDADSILHPHLLTRTAAELRTVSAFCCAPRMAPPELDLWATPGDLAAYERMLGQCKPVAFARAVGVFMVLPAAWLADQRGFDEAYTGWGHEDTEMWWRVRGCLPHRKDIAGSQVIHQWHPRQPGAGEQGPNWPLFIYRMANSDAVANPTGWGGGQITESVLRAGLTVPQRDDRKSA
jgi:glycosyl transferase family 2